MLIGEPWQWRRMVYAMNVEGQRVDWDSRDAIAFCATGALLRAAYDLSGNRAHAFTVTGEIAELLTGVNHRGLALITLKKINDAIGHAAILNLFNTAIQGVTPRPCARITSRRLLQWS
jgi:hypothetical protein